MTTGPENTTEFYFDVSSGQLLIGQLAVDTRIETGGHPADIYSLPQLLLAKERLVDKGTFRPSPQNEQYSRADFSTVRWLHRVVSDYDPKKAVTEEIIGRASFLGLSPSRDHFRKFPAGLSGLYKAAGLENARQVLAFDTWTTYDCANYIRGLGDTLGRRPRRKDIIEAGRKPENPGFATLRARFQNKLGPLYMLAGYFTGHDMDREDFINWGVLFMEANEGKIPTSNAMDILSPKGFAPAASNIYARDDFSSILDFQTEVMFAYEEKMQYKKEVREAQLLEINRMLGSNPNLKSMTNRAQNEDDLLRIFAKFRLVKHFVPDIESKTVSRVCAAKDPSKLVDRILELAPNLTVADIEAQAEAMHVYDTIWPMDSYLQDLKVA